MPALNVTREEISEMIDGLDAILTKAGAARRVRVDSRDQSVQPRGYLEHIEAELMPASHCS